MGKTKRAKRRLEAHNIQTTPGMHDVLQRGNARVGLVLHTFLIPLLSVSQNGSMSGINITAQKLFHVIQQR
jgi:hypothetical protein